jgi:methylmalonyl-CoA mutase N-terminal domain/subunit
VLRRTERLWRKEYHYWIKRTGERAGKTTPSGIPVKPLYTPLDTTALRYSEKLGFPGQYPLTRGIYPTMYRGRPWTIRLVSGFGTSEDSNKRFKFLLGEGETGLSLVLDSPTIYGYDSDDPRVKGEIGQGGAPISSLLDMEITFKDIPIERISTNLVTHYLGFHVFSMFMALADKLGIPRASLRGTTQDDPMWFFHVGNPVLPLKASVKLAVDLLEFCVKEPMPHWFSNSVSGYHMREAGATAQQEAAFTVADATVYLDEAIRRGIGTQQAAHHISFFLDAHDNFFEEVAKFRAMRRVWANLMRKRYKLKDPRSLQFRFHAQTAGSSLTAQEPLNNIARSTVHAMAAILGGCQSLHTDSYDEALGLPTEKAAKLAVRTQQILLHESGTADVIDALGGSYYVEWLTEQMEEGIWKYLDRIDAAGGMYAFTELQLPRKEITESAYRTQRDIEKGDIPKVGVNIHKGPIEKIELCRVTLTQEKKQARRLSELRKRRDPKKADEALGELRKAIEKDENIIPHTIKCSKTYVTTGEIYQVLREIYGVEKAPTMI